MGINNIGILPARCPDVVELRLSRTWYNARKSFEGKIEAKMAKRAKEARKLFVIFALLAFFASPAVARRITPHKD
ncbi:MAG: hypothetical protein ABI977_16510 [Acidobacteriota bacterium]